MARAPATTAPSSVGWCYGAACSGVNLEVFFPGRGESAEPARQICARCPVRQPCLDYAISHGITHGIWGGLAERDRRTVRARHLGDARRERYDAIAAAADAGYSPAAIGRAFGLTANVGQPGPVPRRRPAGAVISRPETEPARTVNCPLKKREPMLDDQAPGGPCLPAVTRDSGRRIITARRRARIEPAHGSALIAVAAWLLALTGAGALFASFSAQYTYILAVRRQDAASVIEALLVDLLMIVLTLLALGLSRAGQSARAERALILACAAASAYMNVSAADLASPGRSPPMRSPRSRWPWRWTGSSR